jgi:hypothetical protein
MPKGVAPEALTSTPKLEAPEHNEPTPLLAPTYGSARPIAATSVGPELMHRAESETTLLSVSEPIVQETKMHSPAVDPTPAPEPSIPLADPDLALRR